jgi:hypothetical protein
MNRISLLNVFAPLVFAAIATGLFLSRPADLTSTVAELEFRLREAKDEISRLKAEAAKAQTKASSLAHSSSDTKPKPGTAGSTDKPNKDGPGMPESLAKLMQDPKMREMVKAQQTMQIDLNYGKLFARLSLEDQEVAHFKKLLGERLAAKTDAGMKMMDSSLKPEQRKALAQELDQSDKASDAAIKEFLNDDGDFQTFKHWEDTEPERMQLMMGKSAFEGAGVPLSEDQESQLVDLMYTARKRPSDIPDWNDPKQINPADFAKADFKERILAKSKADTDEVTRGAAAFLSPDQMKALERFADQMKSMQDMGLKMSETMFGGGKK